MDRADKEAIIKRYNTRLARYGNDIRTLASGTEERREIRFQVLCEAGVSPGSSVLDIGCGFGDFYGYLLKQGVDVGYVGYDINPQLIEIARKKYPEAEFVVRDIQVDSFPTFDFVVSSSAFNLRLDMQDNYEFIEEMLRACFSHSRHGVAIDFMSSYVDYQSPHGFHYNPERVFSIAKKITKRVCLRHDYPLYEFCIYVYPDFEGWRSKHA